MIRALIENAPRVATFGAPVDASQRRVGRARGMRWRIAACVAMAGLASGCGGGSGGSGGEPVPSLEGTAAVGSPVAGGTIALACNAGSRSGTTMPDGRYRIDLSGLVLPCVARLSGGKVDGIDSPWVLTSVVTSPGIANLTPWTHLVMARALRTDPAVAGAADAVQPGQLSASSMDEAGAHVRAEIGRLLGAEPADQIDPFRTAFTASPEDGMDVLLDQLMNGLRWNGKTLAQAALEISTGSLQSVEVAGTCRPGVFTGFTGKFDDVPVQVARSDDAGEGGGDGAAGGGDGAGAGGSLGQFLNAVIRVERSDGSLLGEARTDATRGMVTVVPCRYQGPVRLTVKARPDGESQYYEESTGQYAAFPAGETLNAVVPRVTKNVGITLLTEAAWQYLDAKYGADGWKDAGRVAQANAVVSEEFNRFLPKDLTVSDITRLPFLVGGDTRAGSIGTTPNDVYGLVSSGLARAAGLLRSGDLAPALKLVRQLGRDFCDGVVDLRCNGTPVVANAADAAYLPSQFGESLNRGVGDVVTACGTSGAGEAAFRVTQIAISASPTQGPSGEYFVESYHGKQPIYLLRSDGRAFYWADRQSAAEPFMPGSSFNQIFPQSGYYFAGIDDSGQFVSKSNAGPLGDIVPQPAFAKATTTAGYVSATGHSSQVSRLPTGQAVYFPHYDRDDPTRQMQTKVVPLDNVIGVGWAQGDDNQGNPGWGPGTNGKDVPTYFALTGTGELYAWGNDRYGILGDGKPVSMGNPTPGTGTPQKVAGLPPIGSVVGFSTGVYALDLAGQVWSWGSIDANQSLLGGQTGEINGVSTPVLLKDLFAVHGALRQISCGVGNVCAALSSSGKLLAWGRFGFEDNVIPPELAVPLKKFGLTEVPLPKDRRVSYLGSSQDMVYAVLDDGTLVLFPTYPTFPAFIDTRQVLPAATAGSSTALTCRR